MRALVAIATAWAGCSIVSHILGGYDLRSDKEMQAVPAVTVMALMMMFAGLAVFAVIVARAVSDD